VEHFLKAQALVVMLFSNWVPNLAIVPFLDFVPILSPTCWLKQSLTF
jgi:hypothetical protein